MMIVMARYIGLCVRGWSQAVITNYAEHHIVLS